MAVRFRPGIVTSDLVLALDIYDPRSYPGSGNTWFDLSGNRLHMTCNASNLTSTGLNSGASASTATTDILNTDTHTICLAIKFMGTETYPNGYIDNWEQFFDFSAGGSDRTPGVWRYPSSRHIHWRYDPSNTGNDFGLNSLGSGGAQFALNTWYYITQTKNGTSVSGTATAYVNGVLLGSGTVSSPKTRGTAAVRLFNYYTAGLAQIGCVHVYRKPLTQEEIMQNFTTIRGNFGI
jgi:hypothetical protein